MLLVASLGNVFALDGFARTESSEANNENEFGALVSAITSKLGGKAYVLYVRSGDRNMLPRSRDPRDREDENRSKGLKPDFFTTRVKHIGNCYLPQSHSAFLNPIPPEGKSRRSQKEMDPREQRPSTTILQPEFLLYNNGSFTWEDVGVLWEVKSTLMSKIERREVWANMILKATEVLRYQWYRTFVLGFLVCGTEVCMFRVDRSCVLVSRNVDIRGVETTNSILVRSILATLVLPDTALGFLGNDSLERVYEAGKPRLAVFVNREKFLLGRQISFPTRDRLTCRATTAHVATKEGDRNEYCYKNSWPYADRQHEGDVLHQLQGVPGVVRLIAWDPQPPSGDAPPVSEGVSLVGGGAPTDEQSFSLYPSPKSILGKPNVPRGSVESKGPLLRSHIRQRRQTVTEYIPNHFGDCKNYTLLELLFGNELSAVLIDFDLATKIVENASGAPDRTGTPAFMSLEVLQNAETGLRHQELHEAESAFWVGLFAFMRIPEFGHQFVQKLMVPGISLGQIHKEKYYMVSMAGMKVGAWLEVMKTPPGVKMSDWNLVLATCEALEDLHFRSRNSNGVNPFHSKNTSPEAHKKFFGDVDKVLTDKIDALRGETEG
ncbi:MAG: hypothetical protein M1839_007386 [Geoglossum umbratile]|nr:MAG: hypothetical protein M1839_007386 [Geoglossum umbratile]